jgi:hypothetical protein
MFSAHFGRTLGIVAWTSLALAALGCSSPGYPKKVRVETDGPNASCDTSKACQVWGWCADEGGQCVAGTDDHCRSSQACKQGGLCSLDVDRCIAKTDDDCARSEWCDKYDLCDAEQGVCR